MANGWLEITDANGTRREELRDGLTRVGGGDAEVTLAGVGSDQVHIWASPLRAVFVGEGAPPFSDGAPFMERDFAPGEFVEWAGARLTFCAGASLEEIAFDAPIQEPLAKITPVAMSSSAETVEEQPAPSSKLIPEQARARAWNRVRAGLYVDVGQADPKVVARWQAAVVAGDFDVDECADQLIGSAKEGDELRLLERSGRLMRDFLMASMMRGMKAAGRNLRTRARGGVAFLIAQSVALLVYSLIVVLSMLFLRVKGTSFDGFFDSILGAFGG